MAGQIRLLIHRKTPMKNISATILRNYRNIIVSLWGVFLVLSLCNGCSTCFFTVIDEDIKTLENMELKRYQLSAAVICSDLNNYTINLGTKDAFEWYFYGFKNPCLSGFNIKGGAKEFFSLIFKKVDYVNEADFNHDKYDIIVRLIPTYFEDFTKTHREAKESVRLRMIVNVLIANAKSGKPLLDWDIEASGECCPSTNAGARWNYHEAAKIVTRSFFLTLGQKLAWRPNPIDEHLGYFAEIKQKEIERETLPAKLTLNLEYSDSQSIIPNNTIDAGEESLIIADISNMGQGRAFDVKLKVASGHKDISSPKSIPVGNIKPKETKRVHINLDAGLNLRDGKTSFLLHCSEKRGYDSQKLKLIISTAALEKPKLLITRYEINDSNTGLAKGNGNGIPENGETIEIITLVENSGVGEALGVALALDELASGIEEIQGDDFIGAVPEHKTAKGRVAIQIPRNYSTSKNNISFRLTASEIRLGKAASMPVVLNYEFKRPMLAFSSKIFHKGREVTRVNNGSTFDLEIKPANNGELLAENVELDVDIPDLEYQPQTIGIGRIEPKSTGGSVRFSLKIPRKFVKPKLHVRVSLKEMDFMEKTSMVEIPLDAMSPRLRCDATLSGIHGGNIIEQDERADFSVQVQNTGNLEAKNVRVKLDIEDSYDNYVKIIGTREKTIPSIPAGAFSETINFNLMVTRQAKPGSLPIEISVNQSDFPDEDHEYILLVRAEGPRVIEVTSTSKQKGVRSRTTSLGPVLAIARPQNGLRTYQDKLDIYGTVADAKGIDRISIAVNSKKVRVKTKATSQINKKEFFATSHLSRGQNNLVITAYNFDNVVSSETLFVHRESGTAKRPHIPPLSLYCDVDRKVMEFCYPAARLDHRKWAVVIGLEKYRNVPSVPYAIRDAQAVKEYFTRLLRIPPKNCFVLLNDEATLGALQDLLEDRLPSSVKRGDAVYFYFAGHGIPQIREGIPYLLPYDGKPSNPRWTAYSSSELYASLGNLKAKNVFVFVDSCFSGAASRGENQKLLVEGIRPGVLKIKDPILAQKNLIVFTAARSDQVSNAYPEKQHGLFTYFLLKGLGGEATRNKSGVISATDLASYLKSSVTDISRREFGPNGKQEPEVKGLRNKDNILIVDGLP